MCGTLVSAPKLYEADREIFADPACTDAIPNDYFTLDMVTKWSQQLPQTSRKPLFSYKIVCILGREDSNMGYESVCYQWSWVISITGRPVVWGAFVRGSPTKY